MKKVDMYKKLDKIFSKENKYQDKDNIPMKKKKLIKKKREKV
tara:strand:- start:1059 stop:1184 length:126 start_codon:yes stop_codon:yes gene_type:complete